MSRGTSRQAALCTADHCAEEKRGELTAVSSPSPCPHRRESAQSEDKEVERCESVQEADPAPAQSAPLPLPHLVVNLALGCMSYFVVLFAKPVSLRISTPCNKTPHFTDEETDREVR